MKSKIIILSFAFLLASSLQTFAHPPKVLIPSYDSRTDTLTVDIVHTTTNPAAHYIYKVEIFVNDRLVKEDDTLGGQDSSNGTQYVTFLKGVSSGDSIKVIAYCNRGGQKTGTIVVAENTASSSSSREAKESSQIPKSAKESKKSYSSFGF